MIKRKNNQLTTKQYAKAMVSVAGLSFRIAPAAVMFKLFGIAVNAALPIALTYFAAQTISQLTAAYNGNPTAGRLAITYAIISAVLGLASTAWGSFDSYIQQVMRFKIEAKVSDLMYSKFLSLEFWRYDDKATIDVYDRAHKFSQFYSFVFDRLSSIITQLVTLVFALTALFAFMPLMALSVLVAVLPGLFIQFKLSRHQLAHWNDNLDARRAKSFIEWNLFQPSAISELRLNGLVRHFMALRQKLRNKDEGGRLAFERKFIPLQLLSDALEAVIELGALLWIVVQITNRAQPLGQFIYVQQLVSRAIGSANRFVSDLSNIDEDLGNLYDYQKFMEFASMDTGGSVLQKPPQKIRFENVSFRYPNHSNDVLQNVNFEITSGEHIAIVGENGAGKTTLVKLLTGMYEPTDGRILVDGQDLREAQSASWLKQLSVLQQDFQRYYFADIEDNVYFGDVDKTRDAQLFWSSVDAAEATEFIDKLSHKEKTYPGTWMDDEEGNPGTELSGGQWQRIALARSFYRNAPIVVMDEPTSAIDALAEARIFDRLFDKANNKTVITISHRLSTVEKADNILVFDDGRLVEAGTHAKLVANDGQYVKLFKRQLK